MRRDESQDVIVQQHAREIAGGERFAFGENWKKYLECVDEDRIAEARLSLQRILGLEQLGSKSFLDIGSGSGLFSLAARRLGATVTSFDYDSHSVACTRELRRRFRDGDPAWNAAQGSVLDSEFLRGLGTFDIVYSWGVLHHTGAMWQAIENAVGSVAPNGTLILAIYNDQGWVSDYWRFVKRAYSLRWLRPLILGIHAPYLLGLRVLVRALTGRLDLSRGMSYWHDMVDWLGGYPFEVAKPDDVICFMHRRGFVVKALRICGSRHGCNEYVFAKAKNGG